VLDHQIKQDTPERRKEKEKINASSLFPFLVILLCEVAFSDGSLAPVQLDEPVIIQPSWSRGEN
jgi:hypothetical protein